MVPQTTEYMLDMVSQDIMVKLLNIIFQVEVTILLNISKLT